MNDSSHYVILALAFFIAGCGSYQSNYWYDGERDPNQKPPRIAPHASSQNASSDNIIVTQGDTYYSLARAYQVDLRALIEVNKARPPYALKKGQRLKLPIRKIHKVKKGDTLYNISRRYHIDLPRLLAQNNLQAPYQIFIGQEIFVNASGAAKPKKRQKPKAVASALKTLSPSGRFLMPVKGRVISRFGPKQGGLYNDGIDIAAPKGTSIRAAEAGVVLYVGNDIKSLGNLMIIHHGNGWISSYGNMDGFAAKQGEKIRRGQIIGRVGQSGNAKQPQLHFELRRHKNAVNPQKYI